MSETCPQAANLLRCIVFVALWPRTGRKHKFTTDYLRICRNFLMSLGIFSTAIFSFENLVNRVSRTSTCEFFPRFEYFSKHGFPFLSVYIS